MWKTRVPTPDRRAYAQLYFRVDEQSPVIASPPCRRPCLARTDSAPPSAERPSTGPHMPSGATSRPRIDLRRAWPRRRYASTTSTGSTCWRSSRQPGYAAQPRGCVEAETARADGSRPCTAARHPAQGLAGDPCRRSRDGPGIQRHRRDAGPRRDSTAASATRRWSWRFPAGPRPSPPAWEAAFTRPTCASGPTWSATPCPGPGGHPDPLQLCLTEGLAGVLYAVRRRRARARGGGLQDLLEPHDRAVLAALDSRGRCCVWSTSPGPSPSSRWRHRTPTSSAGRRVPICRRSLTATGACGPPRSAGSTPVRSGTSRRRPWRRRGRPAQRRGAGAHRRARRAGVAEHADEVLTAVIRALAERHARFSASPLTPSVRGADRARRPAPSAGGRAPRGPGRRGWSTRDARLAGSGDSRRAAPPRAGRAPRPSCRSTGALPLRSRRCRPNSATLRYSSRIRRLVKVRFELPRRGSPRQGLRSRIPGGRRPRFFASCS